MPRLNPSDSSSGGMPQQIWNTLLQLGATPTQAAGIMGNMMAESSLNPDGPAGDQGTSFGLFQQHGAYGYLVTGNPITDMMAQIKTMIANGGMQSATGGTPEEVAQNFAHGYERCAACGYQAGDSELAIRASNARNIYNAATSGDWSQISYSSAASGVGAGPAGSSPGSNTQLIGCHAKDGSSNCWINPPGGWCFTHCEAKAVLGGLVLVAGGVLILAGVLVVARGAIQSKARNLVGALGPAGVVAAGAAARTEAGLGAARRVPAQAPRSAPGPATSSSDRRTNRSVQREGSEAYDAGYQRAMMDFEARSRESETPF